MSNGMQVPPSTVLYTACAGDPGTEGVTEDSKLEEMAARLLANSDELTLQVVEKDGYYFTLNNTQLQVCQWLENRGRCSKVQLLMVPLKAVPDGIKQMMVAPRVKADDTEKYMTITYEPMERRPRTARDDDDDNDDHSGSDDSDGYDSDSLCDEADIKEQQQRRRRQSEESGQEEDASLL